MGAADWVGAGRGLDLRGGWVSGEALLPQPARPVLGEVTWTTSLCECEFCGNRWQSVHPHGVEIMCPACGRRGAIRVD